MRRGNGLRLTLTQTVPKTLGAVSITLWYLLRGVRPPAATDTYHLCIDSGSKRGTHRNQRKAGVSLDVSVR